MLPWLPTPWRAQAAFGQGGNEVRRLFANATGDFEMQKTAIKSC